MNNFLRLVLSSVILAVLYGCAATGQQYAANSYDASQVNSRQEAKTVDILAVLPAKIKVDNTRQKREAQLAGGILGAVAGGILGSQFSDGGSNNTGLGAAGGAVAGAAAGSLVPDTTLVDGVSISYEDGGHTYNSVQVGRSCEFVPGRAILVATSSTVTRIQPNATCPVQDKNS